MKDCDPIEQEARFKQLEDWYEKDGRLDKKHPDYGTYTGLAAKYGKGDN